MLVRGSYDVTAMCLQATGLPFFQICHCAELNEIVEATMPANGYDDCKVSLQRPHGNGDLDIVRASYTCCKANVTVALMPDVLSLGDAMSYDKLNYAKLFLQHDG